MEGGNPRPWGRWHLARPHHWNSINHVIWKEASNRKSRCQLTIALKIETMESSEKLSTATVRKWRKNLGVTGLRPPPNCNSTSQGLDRKAMQKQHTDWADAAKAKFWWECICYSTKAVWNLHRILSFLKWSKVWKPFSKIYEKSEFWYLEYKSYYAEAYTKRKWTLCSGLISVLFRGMGSVGWFTFLCWDATKR